MSVVALPPAASTAPAFPGLGAAASGSRSVALPAGAPERQPVPARSPGDTAALSGAKADSATTIGAKADSAKRKAASDTGTSTGAIVRSIVDSDPAVRIGLGAVAVFGLAAIIWALVTRRITLTREGIAPAPSPGEKGDGKAGDHARLTIVNQNFTTTTIGAPLPGGDAPPVTAPASPAPVGGLLAPASTGQGGVAAPPAAPGMPAVAAVPATADATSETLYWRQGSALFEALLVAQRYRTLAFSWRVVLNEQFDVAAEATRTIEAVDTVLVALCGARSSVDAPMAEFEAMRLEVFGRKGAPEDWKKADDKTQWEPLHWIPTRNTPHEKSFVAFLPQPLCPGDGVLTIVWRGTWRRAAAALAPGGRGWDDQKFTLPAGAVGDIPAPSLRIELPSGAGRFRLTCQSPRFVSTVPDDLGGGTVVERDLGPSKPGREVRVRIERLPG